MGTMGLALGPCSLPGQVVNISLVLVVVVMVMVMLVMVMILFVVFWMVVKNLVLVSVLVPAVFPDMLSIFLYCQLLNSGHGQGPLFTVAADAMELGLGVHGEAGVASMPLSNAR